MSDVKLTKDSDALICLLYKAYCEAIKNGIDKYTAKQFGSCEEIQKRLTPNWSLDDTLETANELCRTGFLECCYCDNTFSESNITDTAIIYMESRFSNNLNEVIDYIGKIRNLIPFV